METIVKVKKPTNFSVFTRKMSNYIGQKGRISSCDSLAAQWGVTFPDGEEVFFFSDEIEAVEDIK